MLRTSNPVLSSKSFGGFVNQPAEPLQGVREERMTIPGTINKTTILLALVMVAALWPWKLMQVDPVSGAAFTRPETVTVWLTIPKKMAGVPAGPAPVVILGHGYTGNKLDFGVAFTQQFQSLEHQNSADPKMARNGGYLRTANTTSSTRGSRLTAEMLNAWLSACRISF